MIVPPERKGGGGGIGVRVGRILIVNAVQCRRAHLVKLQRFGRLVGPVVVVEATARAAVQMDLVEDVAVAGGRHPAARLRIDQQLVDGGVRGRGQIRQFAGALLLGCEWLVGCNAAAGARLLRQGQFEAVVHGQCGFGVSSNGGHLVEQPRLGLLLTELFGSCIILLVLLHNPRVGYRQIGEYGCYSAVLRVGLSRRHGPETGRECVGDEKLRLGVSLIRGLLQCLQCVVMG